MTDRTASERVAEVKLWYHTIDLGEGRATPGWFDLRPVIDEAPWPDVHGKRCLDIATFDGFLAFELEKRGAKSVLCTDIPSHEDWDHLPRELAAGKVESLSEISGEKGLGFEIARELLDSSVERMWCNIYDLDPDVHGTFEVVTLGSLLLHLRDPMRALAAVSRVCEGEFLSIEQVDPLHTVLHPKRPVMKMHGSVGQWMYPNVAGHRRMLEMAGFDVLEQTTFSEHYGVAHPDTHTSVRARAIGMLERVRFGNEGVPVSAIRARRGV